METTPGPRPSAAEGAPYGDSILPGAARGVKEPWAWPGFRATGTPAGGADISEGRGRVPRRG